MTRVFESYGIEPYVYFVQENLQVNFTNDFGQLAERCAIIDRQWNGEAVANLSFKNKYGFDTCSMKVFVIEIIQSPVDQMKLLLIFFFIFLSGICVLDKSESDSRQKFAQQYEWKSIDYGTHFFVFTIRQIKIK